MNGDAAEALHRRGHELLSQGRADEALAAFTEALADRPDSTEILCSRGNLLFDRGDTGAALADYDRVIALRPDAAAVHYNRGNALVKLGRAVEAIAAFDRALALDPHSAATHHNRAEALAQMGLLDRAIAGYQRAITLNSGFGEAVYGLGICLARQGRISAALKYLERANALRPGWGAALADYGNALAEDGQLDAALACFDKAAALQPDYPYLEGARLFTRLRLSDWRDFERDTARLRAHAAERSQVCSPFTLLPIASTPHEQRHCAEAFVADRFPGAPARPDTPAHDRIRLAYISGAFREHPVTLLMSEVFARHDRSQFEVTAIALCPDDGSPERANLEKAFDRLVDVSGKEDIEAAALMRTLEIDIAIDLDGFAQGSRTGVLAQRPAPIQVSYLGYPGTSGANYIDYLIADAVVIPPDEAGDFHEKIVRLPGTFFPGARRPMPGAPRPRTAWGLPATGFVFCAFNNNYKITPDIFSLWMRLLAAAAASVLWLSDTNPSAKTNLRREAQRRGIAADRLIFAPRMAAAEHFARLGSADLFLDTLHYNAHTTAGDALWSGLPVLTVHGASFCGRVADSQLKSLGLEELVAPSLAAYEALALALAQDKTRLAALRAKLANCRDTARLFDPRRTVRDLESALTRIWRRHRSGAPPESFSVLDELQRGDGSCVMGG